MKIALAQMRMDKSPRTNLRKSLQAIETAADGGADLIFFPELQLYPFFPQYEKRDASQYALSTEDAPVKQIAGKCGERRIMAFPNLYLSRNGAFYDASLFIDADGAIQGISKMVHIMRSRYFYEQDYYTPSDDGFQVYDTPFGKIGIVICFDRHLPESIRICVARGADLILIPTANIEGEPLELYEWEIRVQAMQSSVFIAMCNRVGREDNMNFIGRSLVVDPDGDSVVKADDAEQILFAEIDLKASQKVRSEKPFFRLRRPEMYL